MKIIEKCKRFLYIFAVMENRIKIVAKTKGIKLQEVAEKVGITRQGLNSQMKRQPSIQDIEKIADALNCHPFELLEPGSDYSHFYDTASGEWLGVRKK